MKEIKPPSNEERIREIKEYIKYVVTMIKKKEMKGVSPSVYISDVEFLLGLLEGKREEKPILLGPAVPLSGLDIDDLIEKEKRKIEKGR